MQHVPRNTNRRPTSTKLLGCNDAQPVHSTSTSYLIKRMHRNELAHNGEDIKALLT
jgi:hypothetical protein